MKRIATYAAVGLLMGMTTTAVAGDLSLEPCINGGVSANGLYPTQALEDAATDSGKLVKGRRLEGESADSVRTPRGIGSGKDDVISAFGGNRDGFLR